MNGRDGERMAYANSVWVLMDTKKGIPVRVTKEISDAYGLDPQLPMQCSERKIMLPEKYEEKDSLVVPSYFIDTNHHMNNTRYVQVAMEYVPKEFRTMEVRVEYKKAAMCRDVIVPHVTIENPRVTVALCAPDGQLYAVVVFLKA